MVKIYSDKTKRWQLFNDECVARMNKMTENSVDSIVCDPPYGIKFMNAKWDEEANVAFKKETWEVAYRVLKPGGYLVAFGGERTEHRMTCAIEDAGFLIRHKIMWLYGTGFAKGQNIAKAIDKAEKGYPQGGPNPNSPNHKKYHAPKNVKSAGASGFVKKGAKLFNIKLSKLAQRYVGLNTQIKPSYEPIVICQKPISEKTIAKNVLKWGVGAFNIDACRISIDEIIDDKRLGGKGNWKTDKTAKNIYSGGYKGKLINSSAKGRYPANTIHDGSSEVMVEFAKYGHKKFGIIKPSPNIGKIAPSEIYGKRKRVEYTTYGGEGTIARFFYAAKASKLDRALSKHLTIKNNKLMRYLCRLVTPPNGKILDPFCGSGSTLQAANQEGFLAIGIEKEVEYCQDIRTRMRLYRQGHLENIKTFNAYKAAQLEKEKANESVIRNNAKQPKSSNATVATKSKTARTTALRPKPVKKEKRAKKASRG